MRNKKLFISYRRSSWSFTYWLVDELSRLLDTEPFVDYSGIDETDFEHSLLRNLRESAAVLVVVSEDTFDPARIHHDNDWVRREIREALTLKIPVALACFNGLFPPNDLPEDIQAIRKAQGIEFYPRYFKAGVRELGLFLDKATPIKLQQASSKSSSVSPILTTRSPQRVTLDEAIHLHEEGQYDQAIEIYERLMMEDYRPRLISIEEFRNKAVAEREAEQRQWVANEIYDEISSLFRIDLERGAKEYNKFLKDYPEFTNDPAGLAQKLKELIPSIPTVQEKISPGRLIAKLPRVHGKQINSIAFSPDSSLLASCSGGQVTGGDTRIRIWNVARKTYLSALEGHTNSTWCVAFSPDGKLLASGSNDRTVRL